MACILKYLNKHFLVLLPNRILIIKFLSHRFIKILQHLQKIIMLIFPYNLFLTKKFLQFKYFFSKSFDQIFRQFISQSLLIVKLSPQFPYLIVNLHYLFVLKLFPSFSLLTYLDAHTVDLLIYDSDC
jgi:hypothetical protein